MGFVYSTVFNPTDQFKFLIVIYCSGKKKRGRPKETWRRSIEKKKIIKALKTLEWHLSLEPMKENEVTFSQESLHKNLRRHNKKVTDCLHL